mmetsp:Transcript_13222/g.21646  ORF Transcript_13222/g.21646 Transcript_13222/m.21646 type:complete len:516 (+) Transcript_13222:207-1754(+)
MVDTFLPAFEACISPAKGGASCVMCSYNSINGVPSCANKDLLQKTRVDWAFDGYITSDCGATEDIYSTHHYADTPEEAVSLSLQAGMDMDCGRWFSRHLADTVEAGTSGVSMTDVDKALRHLFTVHMRLGRFDPPSAFDSITMNDVNTPAHQQLAVEAAQQSMVLLKNIAADDTADSTSLLPYSNDIASIALVGPNADATTVMLGNYHGRAPYIISPLEAMQTQLPDKVVYAKGCDIDSTDTSGFEDAASAVRSSVAAVVVVGLDQSQEKEGHDREQIALPGNQADFIEAMLQAASVKVTLVVMSGGAVCLNAYRNDPRVGAIIFTGYPGQAGGTGLVDALFGQYNPSGRLSQTFYSQKYMNEVSFFDMNFRPGDSNPGRSYRFYTGENVEYPFGHGLSYTQFEYQVEVEKIVEYGLGDAVVAYVNVLVKNVGKVAGADTVLVYLRPPAESGVTGQPIRLLKQFEKFSLSSGAEDVFSFSLSEDDFSLADSDGGVSVVHGTWELEVGDVQKDIVI